MEGHGKHKQNKRECRLKSMRLAPGDDCEVEKSGASSESGGGPLGPGGSPWVICTCALGGGAGLLDLKFCKSSTVRVFSKVISSLRKVQQNFRAHLRFVMTTS